MESTEIAQGMNLHFIRSEKFKTVSVALLIRRRLDKSEATKNAIIPKILKRGCVKYPNLRSINRKTEEMYGAVFDATIMKKGEEQIIQFFLEIIEPLRDGLEFLKEIALNPLLEDGCFVEDYVNGEKENLRKAIEGRTNNKKEFAKLRCVEEMCASEPFGIYGDGFIKDLDGIDHRNLYEHYRHVLDTSPIDFIVIGNCDSDYLSDCVKGLFRLQRDSVAEIAKANWEAPKQKTRSTRDEQDIQQGKLCMGLRANVPPLGADYYALLVANEIFGGGSESKLFNNLREKESLCYYVNSFIYRFKSILFIQSGVDGKHIGKAVELIEKELETVRNGGISAEEFKKAKMSLVKRMTGILDYPSAVMDFYLGQRIAGDGDTVEQVIDRLRAVTKRDSVRAFENVWVDMVYMLLPAGMGE